MNSNTIAALDLAELEDSHLTEDDVATLRHLMESGIGPNSLRALRGDLAYLEAWMLVCDGVQLSWPPTEEQVLKFVAHHLWDPEEHARNPKHGMPKDVEQGLRAGGFLKANGPHAPSTVERRLASWSSLCRYRGVEGPFGQPSVRRTIRSAMRASTRVKTRKSQRVVDETLMERLLVHLSEKCVRGQFYEAEYEAGRLRAFRDRALLAVMFGAGGRRRSEMSNLVISQIKAMERLEDESSEWPDGIPSLGLRLGRTKTTDVGDDELVFLAGRPVKYLKAWLRVGSITEGGVFRRISRYGKIFDTPINGGSINTVLKKRLAEIGEDPAGFSAHGVRAGYVTTALKAGIPAAEVMAQTKHKSVSVLLGYYKDEEQRQSRAARLLS
jgi:integrase